MGYAEFALTVILISASGVFSPGPLLISSLIYGSKYGYKAGLRSAYGHTIVELPLILMLAYGVINLEVFPEFRSLISMIGGVALLAFASLQIISTLRKHMSIKETHHNPLFMGIIFSALNPFFIIWWLTIGMKLISDALLLDSLNGLIFMFLAHIWMDYLWLTSMAHLSSKGVKVIGNRYYRFLLIGFSLVLIYFGVNFINAV